MLNKLENRSNNQSSIILVTNDNVSTINLIALHMDMRFIMTVRM
jgi:hypothetical protein